MAGTVDGATGTWIVRHGPVAEIVSVGKDGTVRVGRWGLDRDLRRLPVIGDPDERSRAMTGLRRAMLEGRAVRVD